MYVIAFDVAFRSEEVVEASTFVYISIISQNALYTFYLHLYFKKQTDQ